jgi:hypothetical protein
LLSLKRRTFSCSPYREEDVIQLLEGNFASPMLPPATQGKPVTIGILAYGFGDIWKTVQVANYLRRLTPGTPVRVYANWHGFPGENFSRTPLADKSVLAREMSEVLDVAEPVAVVTDTPLDQVSSLRKYWPLHFPHTRTRIRWRGWSAEPARRIAYQLDGQWAAELKNPPPRDLEHLLTFAPGYEMVRVGKPFSVQQCVEVLAGCDLFFGVCSGMAQLAYDVGVPVFLIGYQGHAVAQLMWHGDKRLIYCEDTDDFIAKARWFLGIEDSPTVTRGGTRHGANRD